MLGLKALFVSFLFIYILKNCVSATDVQLRECKDGGKNCKTITTDQHRYFIRPNVQSLNRTEFVNNQDVTYVIGYGLLKNIQPGSFDELKKVTHIWLGGNLLKYIKYGVFNNLTLSYLYLAANNIHNIDTQAFSGLDNLKMIFLDKNSLSSFEANWFSENGKESPVERLYLHHNRIKAINRNAFNTLPNVREIDLSFNEIDFIADDAFNNNANLRLLDLSFNKLAEISPDIIGSISKIDKMVLSFNYLHTVSPKILDKTSISSISIHPNPLICSCMDKFEYACFKKNITSFNSHDTINTQLFKYKLNFPVTYLDSRNMSICFVQNNANCDDQNDEERNEYFGQISSQLTDIYGTINTRCVKESDCKFGSCRSNYCWFTPTLFQFDVKNDDYFVWGWLA